MSPRSAADVRLRRLLAMIPWVAASDGPTVEEVTERFGISEDELAGDLDLLYMCGLWPYTPDMLIEADIADGRVWIRYAEYFSRPLRLTPAEGLALVASGRALLAQPGVDAEGPLARGLAKLAAAMGLDADDTIDVQLAAPSAEVLDVLRSARERRTQVEIDYYAYGRDARSRRVVEPWDVFSQAGQWYVRAHCHLAGGERLFRLDRIREAVPTHEAFTERVDPGQRAVFSARPDDPTVVLDLAPEVAWVAEQYPHAGIQRKARGRLRVRLQVSEAAWLDRLLLRLGGRASVVEGPADVSAAARRVLARYQRR